MSSERSIEQCILEIATGDFDALEWIFKRMRAELMGVAFSVLGDIELSADVIQDTMIRVLETSALFKPETNGRAWIATICRNKAIDAVRRRSRVIYTDLSVHTDTIMYERERKDDLISVYEELSKFDQRDREIFIKHGLQGYTFKTIAAQLEMNAGTVRSRFSRVLTKLRNRLAESQEKQNVR